MALALTRAVGEKILIGDNIVVEVARIQRDKVVLAITAPKEVSIHREEVYEAIKREQMQVAEAACNVMDHKGLAGANAEMEMYRSQDHKQIYSQDSKQGN